MSEPIKTKTCRNCKQTKSTLEFRKRTRTKDGYQYWCKQCTREYQRTQKFRTQQNHYRQSYRQTRQFKEYSKAKNIHDRQSGKYHARQAVWNAIRAGQLPHPDTLQCHYCPKQAEQYHHWSYLPEHWLDVIPVCVPCHNSQG